MSVLISGALIDGAGIPMSGYHIILKSQVNTSEVVMRTVADVVTGNNGEYSFEAQTGKYCVYLKQDWHDEYCVGDISVYYDSTPGTLNDFLTALDEGDLKPDVVARFEEMVAQAQQSAKSSAESAQDAGKHAADAEQLKKDTETLAEEVQQNAQQTAQDREETALNAQASEKSAQDARGYRDSAQQIVEGLNASHATTTQKGLVQLSSATDSDSEERAATSKAVKTVMDEVQTRAPLDSPALTGEPTTPTPDLNAKGREIANAAFVRALIAALVGSVPETLDTLSELAAALGNDPNFATTVTNALAGKQPLNAVLTALSNLTQRADTLPYFNADEDVSLAPLSEKARSLLAQETPEDMRTVLELKSAATMEPQSDIYDFTGGRLAIPGAYGYGGFPVGCEYFDAYRGPSEFEAWVKATPPGRYFVTQSGGTGINNIIPDGIYFRGMVEILPARSGWSIDNHTESDKLVIFYGDEGNIYTNRFNPRFNPGQRLTGWVNAIFRDVDVGYVLKSCGGTYIGYNPPAPGGLVLAAYCGGSDRKICRNLSVSGSQLALVSVMTSTGQGASALQASVDTRSMTSNTMPGLYYSLSGSPFITCDESMAMIGLFVRIA